MITIKKYKIPSGLIIVILISGIVSLDLSRRYLSGEFDDTLQIQVLYSSEKARWLEAVVEEFENQWTENNSGEEISVLLNSIGSGKGTLQIVNEAIKPTVWSPAASHWLITLNDIWTENHDSKIVDTNSPSLVVSPTIIATWESYLSENQIEGINDLRLLSLNDPNFTFAHTDPFESNSGLGAVIMEAAVAANKNPEELTIKDLANDDVQNWMRELESSAIQYGASTGYLGILMATEGSKGLKAAILYENIVIEKNKELTKDKLRAIYPIEGTLLNEHPFAILDAPWVNVQEKIIAEKFLDFLLSIPIQKRAIDFGFRPSVEDPLLNSLVNTTFTLENGVLNSLKDIKIYSIANIDPEVLRRIPDLWTATRTRSANSNPEVELELTFSDFLFPAAMLVLILIIVMISILQRLKHWLN